MGIGNEPARIRVRHLSGTGNTAGVAIEVINRMLSGAGVQTMTTLRSANDPDTGGPIIDITGDDSGLLIGRRGETLRALQYLVNLVTNKKLGNESVRVVLDIERYRERRQKSLREMALRVAEKVASSGRSIPLEPMSAAERRVIHMALADHPKVSTESSGMGESRKVTIAPKES